MKGNRKRGGSLEPGLGTVRTELDRRLAALREGGVRDLEAGTASGLPPWPRVLVVVDELAELTVRDLGDDRAARDAQKAATGRLTEIARLGRAVGIHLIVCTQRPDAEAVPVSSRPTSPTRSPSAPGRASTARS